MRHQLVESGTRLDRDVADLVTPRRVRLAVDMGHKRFDMQRVFALKPPRRRRRAGEGVNFCPEVVEVVLCIGNAAL